MAKRVLVVDDHADFREMLATVLEALGYEASTAGDGAEALEVVRELRPDLILMDIGLPKVDGLTATRAIHGIADFSGLPIVAVTATRDMREPAIEAGCVEVIEKPFEYERLKAILERHLN